MREDKAQSTRRNYINAAFAFTDWCLKNGLTVGDRLPVPSPATLVYHAAWRAGKGNSPGYIRSCLSGINAYFEWHHFPSILRDSNGNVHRVVARVLRGISRLLSRKVKKRLPITIPLLHEILDAIPAVFPSMHEYDRRAYECFLTNGVYGLLRVSEQAAPTTTTMDEDKTAKGWDMKCKDTSYLFNINAAKNDALRTGFQIETHESGGRWCPVATAKRWCAVRKAPPHAALFQLRNGTNITRARVSKLIKACLQSTGRDEGSYDTHSLRGGGAVSLAAAGFGALVPIMGRWRSDSYLGYLQNLTRDNIKDMHQALGKLGGSSISQTHNQVYAGRFDH